MPRQMGPGTVVGGRYRLQERIGYGSMGSVHRAVDELLGREVAVKLIASLARTEEERSRNEAEAKVLAQLNHHSLITLFDAGTEVSPSGTSIVWLAMELVQGSDLSRRLAKGKLPARQVAYLAYDLAIGLDYMHRGGIVHRDIKPANILLFDYREDETRLRAKLTDFGVAQMAGDPNPQGDEFTGTAGFMSPEQVRSEPAGPHSDVYSLGLVLLRCLTGERAFPGMAVESALARLFRGPEIPDSLGPEWVAILRAMTALEPAERPSAHEVSEVMQDLTRAGRGRRSTAAFEDPERVRAAEELGASAEAEGDPVLDRITALTARLLGVPVAAVSIVGGGPGLDDVRQRHEPRLGGLRRLPLPGNRPRGRSRSLSMTCSTTRAPPKTRWWRLRRVSAFMPVCRCATPTALPLAPSASWTAGRAASPGSRKPPCATSLRWQPMCCSCAGMPGTPGTPLSS